MNNVAHSGLLISSAMFTSSDNIIIFSGVSLTVVNTIKGSIIRAKDPLQGKEVTGMKVDAVKLQYGLMLEGRIWCYTRSCHISPDT